MCGIVGIVTSQGLDPHGAFIEDSLKKLKHRGPDASNHSSFQVGRLRVGFGHRRLAIIGLSPLGDQPMSIGRLTIIFNGEIYNYRELCRDVLAADPKHLINDTELLLRLWEKSGPSCIEQLRGIFSFALLDEAQQTLHLVRDKFGVKPLYYSFNESELTFSSEAWILGARGEQTVVDKATCRHYLLRGHYDRPPQTFFHGVLSLWPGEIIEVSLRHSRPTISKTTRLTHRRLVRSNDSFSAACKNVRELFLQAVERNLTSDVPVGIALSGGLDSAAIACAVRHLRPRERISAFTYVPNNHARSEFRFVKLLEAKLDLSIQRCSVSGHDLDVDFGAFLRAQGEPVQSSRQFAQYVVFRRAGEAGFRVLLEGQGGDEVLAGYHGFVHLRLLDLLSKGRFVAAFRLLQGWGQNNSSYSKATPFFLLGAELGETIKLPGRIEGFVRAVASGDNALRLSREAEESTVQMVPTGVEKRSTSAGVESRFKRGLSEAALRTYLPQLLRQGDRNAMAHSVENRVPLLDDDFVEYVWSLPDEFLLSSSGVTKYIFREAMRGLVPDEIIERRDKVGFLTDGGLVPPELDDSLAFGFFDFDLWGRDEGHSESSAWRRRMLREWLGWVRDS